MEERYEMFTLLLTSIARSMHKIKTEEMGKFNLKSSHLSCIYYLYKNKSLTAKELCDICEEDKANISRSIKHLEENGYLSCYSKTQKRYQCPLRLTKRGIEVGQKICERIDHIVEAVSLYISNEDREAMYRTLSRISDNMQMICERYDEKKSTFRLTNPLRRLKRSTN